MEICEDSVVFDRNDRIFYCLLTMAVTFPQSLVENDECIILVTISSHSEMHIIIYEQINNAPFDNHFGLQFYLFILWFSVYKKQKTIYVCLFVFFFFF